MTLNHAARTFCAAAILCLQPMLVHASPEVGVWWNPNQSGRGFVIDILEGNVLVLSSYLYANDGRATWITSAGVMTDSESYTGRLFTVADGQTLVGSYRAPSAAVDIGAVTIHFTDNSHANLTWPGGSTAIERFRFNDSVADSRPVTGVWWNPSESGRGFTLEVQGGTLVLAGFMYDNAGNPIWYLSAGAMASASHYEGALVKFAGGQSLTGPYQPPSSSVNAGKVTIDFTAFNKATVKLSDVAPPSAAVSPAPRKAEVSVEMQPFGTARAPTSLPATYAGNFSYVEHKVTKDDNATTNQTINVGGNLTWTADPSIPANDGGNVYFPTSGSIQITYSYSLISTAGNCTGTGGGTINVTSALNAGALKVDLYGRYDASLSPAVSYPTTLTCDLNGEHTVVQSDDPLAMHLQMAGVEVFRRVTGRNPTTRPDNITTIESSWNFVAP